VSALQTGDVVRIVKAVRGSIKAVEVGRLVTVRGTADDGERLVVDDGNPFDAEGANWTFVVSVPADAVELVGRPAPAPSPAWSAEVEAEAGGARLTSDQQSLAGLLPSGFTLRERDGLTEILLGETVISSAEDPRQTLRGCFVAIKNALAFVIEVRRWAASGPKGCPPYTSGADGMLRKLDESFALLMQTETSLRARLAAAEQERDDRAHTLRVIRADLDRAMPGWDEGVETTLLLLKLIERAAAAEERAQRAEGALADVRADAERTIAAHEGMEGVSVALARQARAVLDLLDAAALRGSRP
jgi:hypothetical protein